MCDKVSFHILLNNVRFNDIVFLHLGIDFRCRGSLRQSYCAAKGEEYETVGLEPPK